MYVMFRMGDWDTCFLICQYTDGQIHYFAGV